MPTTPFFLYTGLFFNGINFRRGVSEKKSCNLGYGPQAHLSLLEFRSARSHAPTHNPTGTRQNNFFFFFFCYLSPVFLYLFLLCYCASFFSYHFISSVRDKIMSLPFFITFKQMSSIMLRLIIKLSFHRPLRSSDGPGG